MHGAGVRRALAFGVGALALEATGSVFHAYVVQDAPMSPEKMLRGDFLVAGLAGAAMLGWQGLGRGAGGSRAVLAFGLGFLFALFLELLNDAFPGALFRPKDIVGAVVAWSYVLLGTLGASAILSRGGVPKGTP